MKVKYYSPSEIIERATEHMVALETQKAFTKQMATLLSMHLAKVQAMVNDGYSFDQLPKASCFVISPTGTGKSYILKMLAKASGMNVSFIDSTQLTQTGYKGLNLMGAIAQIANENPHFFDKPNLLVFDEFDKMFFNEFADSGYNAHNIQRDLLKLFEGSDYNLKGGGEILSGINSVNLDKTMIVLAGACSDINRVLKNKPVIHKNPLGFSANESPKEPIIEPVIEPTKKADINDLVKYGMLRELAGRVNSVFHIGALTKEDYITIITSDSKVSTLSQYRNLFKSRGCKLSISGSAVNKIADIAIERGMGARTVNGVLVEQLSSAYSFLENHTDYNKATLRVNSKNEFVLNYKKGKRQVFETPKQQEIYLAYRLDRELSSENNINIFCKTICSTMCFNEEFKETFVFTFLQLVCRYFKACIRPIDCTIEGILKFAEVTKRPFADGMAPFEAICSEFLEAAEKRAKKPEPPVYTKPEFIEAFKVFFEIYKENYAPFEQSLLSTALPQAFKQYVNNPKYKIVEKAG